ncbi:hypothetical protein [Mycoplasmopsis gallinacea]|uniref:Uncharacterized protein n=1 Tax=Mycoplasmopsis gallinacea TaxID=29556 RepID=A0A6H0V4E9_9BACT|nr:hypothetical protein [Mycoplasmopsis gallinacea]QIW62346.1 hypothetical protein GOQ20_02840 [Mycoplasmopsis gallinacea]
MNTATWTNINTPGFNYFEHFLYRMGVDVRVLNGNINDIYNRYKGYVFLCDDLKLPIVKQEIDILPRVIIQKNK